MESGRIISIFACEQLVPKVKTLEATKTRRFIGTVKMDNNWKKGKNNLQQIDGHFGTVCAAKFDDTRLVSSSEVQFIVLEI